MLSWADPETCSLAGLAALACGDRISAQILDMSAAGSRPSLLGRFAGVDDAEVADAVADVYETRDP